MKKINFYTTEDGKCPISDFLDSLTGKQVQKVAEKRRKDYLLREIS